MTSPSVVVLDYGAGNVRSAVRALERVGADVELTPEADAVLAADGVVVPGVGAFAAVMAMLAQVDGPRLIGQRLAGGRPVLGICVGMQVMFETGLEHGKRTSGLGHWPGEVSLLQARVVPHMGWSQVRTPPNSVLFDGVEHERFYFVHSYAAHGPMSWAAGPHAPARLTWGHHGQDFVAAVEGSGLMATQFHPEKSGDAGAHLLENWVRALR